MMKFIKKQITRVVITQADLFAMLETAGITRFGQPESLLITDETGEVIFGKLEPGHALLVQWVETEKEKKHGH